MKVHAKVRRTLTSSLVGKMCEAAAKLTLYDFTTRSYEKFPTLTAVY